MYKHTITITTVSATELSQHDKINLESELVEKTVNILGTGDLAFASPIVSTTIEDSEMYNLFKEAGFKQKYLFVVDGCVILTRNEEKEFYDEVLKILRDHDFGDKFAFPTEQNEPFQKYFDVTPEGKWLDKELTIKEIGSLVEELALHYPEELCKIYRMD